MYIFQLYHDDDSYSNYNLNGQPYDTHKRRCKVGESEKLGCFTCNTKYNCEMASEWKDGEEHSASASGDGKDSFNC